jgi:hypothetical protein
MMDEIIDQLKEKENKEFISVEFRNGHFHTVKAHNTWNMWVGSEAGELENQIDYIRFVEGNENTDVYDILTADSEVEARKLGIIDEDGGFI